MLIDLLESSKAIGLCPMGKMINIYLFSSDSILWIYSLKFSFSFKQSNHRFEYYRSPL